MNDKDFETLQGLGCFKQHTSNGNLLSLFKMCNVAGSKQLKQEPYYKTLMVIEGILDIGFNPSDDKEPFCPMFSRSSESTGPTENEKRIWEEVRQHPSWEPGCNHADIKEDGSYMLRSPLPSDLSVEQAQILYRNLDKVESYYLKAKIADVLWESMRLGKYGMEAAKIATKAYFDSVDYAFESQDNDGFKHVVWHLVRASVIMAEIGQYDECFDKLMKFFERKELFEGDGGCELLEAVGSSVLKLRKVLPENIKLIATEYKEMFENIKPACHYVLNESNVWTIGAELSNKAKIPKYKNYFNMEKTKAHFEMTDKFSGSDYDALSNRQEHLKKAILSLRNIEKKEMGIEEMIELANIKLIETEKQIPNSIHTSVEWCVVPKEYFELLKKEFSGLNFEECLSKFVNLYNDALINNYEYIKNYKPKDPSFLVSPEKGDIQKVDDNGKVVSNGNGDGIWLDTFWQSLDGSLINPILEIIKSEHSFSEETIHNLVKGSSFIPPGHYEAFAKGINYFLHGQMLEALSLLMLRVEGCLRHILHKAGISTNIVEFDETEKDIINIRELLKRCQENGILDEKVVFYLKDFVALRNQIAHKASDNIANDPAAYPCCVLILFLVLKRAGNTEIKCNENESEKLSKYSERIIKSGILAQEQNLIKTFVLKEFAPELDLLDSYDHQSLKKPEGTKGNWTLTYEEAKNIIAIMKSNQKSSLFGNEKDKSFESAIATIYQTSDKEELYPSVQEKAANLLYFVVKNHPFSDGNKRIAAALFVYFLAKNNVLRSKNGFFVIDNNTLAAMTLMIALSNPTEKEMMILLVMNFLEQKMDKQK